MIPIGNQTSFSAATPTVPFDYARANDFDAFEWFPDKKPDGAGWDESDLDESRRRHLAELARAQNMRVSVHARWQADPLRPGAQPLLLRDLGLARDLGAVLVNIHFNHEQGVEAYVQAVMPFVRQVGEVGLQLAIENTPHHAPEQFNELFACLQALGRETVQHVGMCFDLGHANLCAATRNDYLQFLDRLDPRVPIIHLHLHENWGDADSHLPLFTGPAGRNDAGIRGLLERLRQRQYAGSIILEQWPQPPSLLNHARDRLLDLLNSCSNGRESAHTSRASDVAASRESAADLSETNLQRSHETPLRSEVDDFQGKLVAADQQRRSWREKLDFVQGLFTDDATPLTSEQLVDIAIYLRFLGTGEIVCVEDGRHFRPAHHARMALEIQRRLAELTTPDTAFIARKIYPWLPSSARSFQRAEPLTRIRDIAHRNDIPQDLKREIKHTLQNKLHRCAGPEDLVTSTKLLERITAPAADYASDFVEQFKIFHEELKEFFNAQSLDERLDALLPHVGAKETELIQRFHKQKTSTAQPALRDAFKSLTELRYCFLEGAAKCKPEEKQEFLLADIGLEDFAFVLLSKIFNVFDVARTKAKWEPLLETLRLTITNLALSRVQPEECDALGAELRTWSAELNPKDREQLLRLKATADRCRRLAEAYSDRIAALFFRRARDLGRALEVPAHAIQVYCDSEIRGHIVFQLAKLVSSLLRRVREQLELPAWDVLVAGQARGRLRITNLLDDVGQDLREPTVVILSNAEGDEEIPQSVTGIVLGHGIPHLSHLGVRARQAGVVLVTCEEPETFKQLECFDGQSVLLSATPENVECTPAKSSAATTSRAPGRPVLVPEVRLDPKRPWLPLEQVTPESGGGKANGARRLAELARRNDAGFNTPTGGVIPFGVMEAALRARPEVEAEYGKLLQQATGKSADTLTATAERLRSLIQQFEVPEAIAKAIAQTFKPDARLIVRSSANCEDLPEMAGAGLYESVANVAPADVADAVRTVWASLWTRRAALSRQQAGIPHEQAHIAVLIQELLTPDCSFVLHTVNPINHDADEVYAELAIGLGETLASAAIRGNPYRLICPKSSKAVTTLAFANFSESLWPDPAGGLQRKTVDYSRVELSRNAEARQQLGRRLAAIGRLVEAELKSPQDIEGAVVGGRHLPRASTSTTGAG